MKTKTIKQLNDINTDFYNSIASDFSASRNYPWIGWDKTIPIIHNIISSNELNILDVGCGNGRYGLFVEKNIQNNFTYTGIDNNYELLEITKDILSQQSQKILKLQTFNIDLIQSLIDDSFRQALKPKKYSLITIFGVMHHIPSFNLRLKLLENLSSLLTDHGVIVLTFWQFMKDERFSYKQIDPKKLNISTDDLEEGDYILDWKRGKLAYRYFHNSDDAEQKKIISKLSKLKVIDSFLSDGKTQNLNRYLIFKKINQL